MIKKLSTSLVALVILLGIPGATLAFDDVKSTDDFYYAVEHLRRNKVIVETKNFRPELVINKAEFVKYLVLINNPDFQSVRNAELPFKDTRNNAWYAGYIKEAIDLGIVDDRNPNFKPFSHLTVTEATRLLFQSKSLPIPKKFVGEIPYRDVKNNKDKGLLMRAEVLGILTPEKSDFLGVNKKVNRALAAQLIFKMEMLDINSSPQRGATSNSQTNNFDEGLQKVINAWSIIKSNYVNRDDIDIKEMSDEAIKGIVETLDDNYSTYLDQDANKNFNDDIEGQFEGIGAYIAIEENGDITIVSPIKDSPAYRSGVQAGDVIRKVDSFDTEGASLQEVIKKIKGPKGTKVRLGLEREGRNITIEVVRGVININAAEYNIIEDGKVAYVKLFTFNEAASGAMNQISQIISKNEEVEGMILDLRGNPGGLLNSAIDIVSLFVPKNSPAVRIKYNYYNVTQSTTRDGILKNFPMVVIIDKGSASASEILAGALQELIGATVVGETSFGKGTVQEVNFFEDDSSLKITVAKWLTPDGKSIQDNGIKPDIEVLRGTAESTDRQLERAIIEINKKIK